MTARYIVKSKVLQEWLDSKPEPRHGNEWHVYASDFERIEPAPTPEEVEKALEAIERTAYVGHSHYGHSDPKGTAGANCPECQSGSAAVDERTKALSTIRAALASPSDWQTEKDAIYDERNRLVAALSKVFPSALEPDPEEPEVWRWFVRIDLPTGQATWHVHESSLPLFEHLERSNRRTWDGHSTEEKYRRVAAILPGLVVEGRLEERLPTPDEVEVTEKHRQVAKAMRPHVLAGDPEGAIEAGRKALLGASATPASEPEIDVGPDSDGSPLFSFYARGIMVDVSFGNGIVSYAWTLGEESGSGEFPTPPASGVLVDREAALAHLDVLDRQSMSEEEIFAFKSLLALLAEPKGEPRPHQWGPDEFGGPIPKCANCGVIKQPDAPPCAEPKGGSDE